MDAAVPIIETDRLILRAHRASDWAACAKMWADEAVVRHIGQPSRANQTWGRILRYRGLWALLGFGYWAIEEKTTQSFVGDIGFADFKREIEPSLEGLPETGWVLATHAHRKGYATEALRAILAWGDVHLTVRTTTCIIAPENIASLNVARKAGYSEHARATYHDASIIILRRGASN